VKWSLLPLLFLLSSACMAYHPPTNVVIYGDDAYPPYSYIENGEAKGIYTEILQAVFEEMPKYRIKITLVPWKRGLKLLEVGEGFALYPPYFYTDKRPYIFPYSIPILNEEVVVYCQPDSVANRKLKRWPADYLGLTIGINEAFALGGTEFWEAVKQGKILLKEAKGNRANILNLYKNRIDCYINDRLSILWEIKLLTQEGVVKPNWELTLGTSISGEQGYLGFTKTSPDKYPYKSHFVERFNQTLKQLQKDGTVDKIMSKYLQNNN